MEKIKSDIKKMKFNLSKWTDSVGCYIKQAQRISKKLWIRPIPADYTEAAKAVLRYKKVDQKVRPVPTKIPEHMKVQRRFPEDPLHNLPTLPHHPPTFQPTLKITEERMDSLGIDDNPELWPEEK